MTLISCQCNLDFIFLMIVSWPNDNVKFSAPAQELLSSTDRRRRRSLWMSAMSPKKAVTWPGDILLTMVAVPFCIMLSRRWTCPAGLGPTPAWAWCWATRSLVWFIAKNIYSASRLLTTSENLIRSRPREASLRRTSLVSKKNYFKFNLTLKIKLN